MQRLSVVLCACMLLAVAQPARAGEHQSSGAGATPRAENRDQPGNLDSLEQWLKLVARHAPGDEDAALQRVAGWPNARLKQLRFDANVLVQIIRSGPALAAGGKLANRFTVRVEGEKTPSSISYSNADLQRLAVLACAAGGMVFDPPCMVLHAGGELDADLGQLAILVRSARLRGDDNYILRHGALLHADVAMLAPSSMASGGEVRRGSLDRVRMTISDGQELDLQQSAAHWELARMLLDFVRPGGRDRADPAHDAMVRQWYIATAAWMQLREDHDKRHLDRARLLFPFDPEILFLSACQRETYAAPSIQTAVQSALLPVGATIDVGSEPIELREAEALFRQVLDRKRDHGEARLRYGHVLGALGKHAEGAAELRRALGNLADRQLLYYAELFLGAEEEALGNRDAARVAYEQAAELYPRAQSALLALSQLARRYDDRRGALRAIDRLFALNAEDRDAHDDPWWWYYVVQARDADKRLEAMRKPYLSERLQ